MKLRTSTIPLTLISIWLAIVPPICAQNLATLTVLHNFPSDSEAGGVIVGSDGNLYGTAGDLVFKATAGGHERDDGRRHPGRGVFLPDHRQ